MTENLQAYGLIGLALVLTIKEIFNSNGRDKLHKRVNKLYDDVDEKYTSKELCDERSSNIENTLKEIKKDVKWLRDNNGK